MTSQFKNLPNDGRTLAPKAGPVGGSLTDTEREIAERGGRCIPVQCDHSKDEEIEKLFEKINKEQSGQLDILVNNAYAAFKIAERGGRCIPVQCDHSKDEEIEKLFEKINKEQSGQLDILVNNAYAAFKLIRYARSCFKYNDFIVRARQLTSKQLVQGYITQRLKSSSKKFFSRYWDLIYTQTKVKEDVEKKTFWEEPVSAWDSVNNVGLRNHYLCTVYAARMMVPRKRGLIVNISSIGGLRYLGDVPYGVGKEALDRMAVDCGHELRIHNVACLSLWPGVVKTENMLHLLSVLDSKKMDKLGDMEIDTLRCLLRDGETAEFTGKAVVHLALDKRLMSKSGRVFVAADLANEYGFKDIDGKRKPSMRQLNFILSLSNMVWLARFIPDFIKIPRWIMALTGNKF